MKKITIIAAGEVGADASHPHTLSTRGRLQAIKLGTALESCYDLVLYSSAPGAAQTAQLVAGYGSNRPQELIIDSLKQNELARIIHNNPRDRSLEKYFLEGLETKIRRLGYEYYQSICKTIHANESRWVLFVTSDPIVSLLAMIFTHHFPENEFIKRKLRPCEGYILTTRKSKYTVTEIELYDL